MMYGGETQLVVLPQVKAVEDKERKKTSQNNIQINRIFILKSVLGFVFVWIRIFIFKHYNFTHDFLNQDFYKSNITFIVFEKPGLVSLIVNTRFAIHDMLNWNF